MVTPTSTTIEDEQAAVDFRNYTDMPTRNDSGERIVEIPLEELHPPEFHPFNVFDDEEMEELAQSIQQYGFYEPGLARPRIDENGNQCGYELIAGNRRKRACEIAGIPTLPVIIRKMDDDDATIAMVDSNLKQRKNILFSERAWAYKVMMEALNQRTQSGNRIIRQGDCWICRA